MKDIMKILAKEIRRVRMLIELMKKFTNFSHKIPSWEAELETLRRILGLMIKKELDKSSDSD